MGIYGIKTPKEIEEKKIERISKRFDLPSADVFELDTAFYSFLTSHDTAAYKLQIKNHIQPLQALYFSQTGQLLSYQINCYAGGFPNITWERDSIFSVFPPRQQAPIHTLVSVSTQIEYLKPLTHSEKINLDNYDYLVFVYWSEFMGRQSRRFLESVKNNRLLSENEKIRVIYVNNDNFFIDKW
jgi:hypothetical protein